MPLQRTAGGTEPWSEGFWKLLAIAATATAVLLFHWPRFNAVTTILGVTLGLLLLTARPASGATPLQRLAFSGVFGLVGLLVGGRLLEEIWGWLPFFYTREMLALWLVLCAAGWLAGRPAADGDREPAP